MYKKPTLLKHTDHADLRLLPVTDYHFARGELVAPIVIDEIADVAREYPIVFPVGSRLPVAMMGVEKDANAYVGAEGQWLATYVPAHIRHYPLALTRIPQAQAEAAEQNRFAILLDVESACVSRHQGEALFDVNGKLAAAAQQKVRIMELMQNRAGATQRLVRSIEEAGLLTERTIRIKRDAEPDRQVTGVRVIDEAALNKLDEAAFNRLRQAGALPLVYASLLSWANFRQGPIGRSHPLPMSKPKLEEEVIRFN
jgi:hypothetical protein